MPSVPRLFFTGLFIALAIWCLFTIARPDSRFSGVRRTFRGRPLTNAEARACCAAWNLLRRACDSGLVDAVAATRADWWRRRELNPRPKQRPPGFLRACPGFWFSPGGSSRRDPRQPARGDCPTSGPQAPPGGDPVDLTPLPGPPERPRATPGLNGPGLQSLLLTQRGRKRCRSWRL